MTKNPNDQQVELTIGSISSPELQLNICNKKFVISYLLTTTSMKNIHYEISVLHGKYVPLPSLTHNHPWTTGITITIPFVTITIGYAISTISCVTITVLSWHRDYLSQPFLQWSQAVCFGMWMHIHH